MIKLNKQVEQLENIVERLEEKIEALEEKQAIIDSHTLRTYEWLCCELGL